MHILDMNCLHCRLCSLALILSRVGTQFPSKNTPWSIGCIRLLNTSYQRNRCYCCKVDRLCHFCTHHRCTWHNLGLCKANTSGKSYRTSNTNLNTNTNLVNIMSNSIDQCKSSSLPQDNCRKVSKFYHLFKQSSRLDNSTDTSLSK